ncbi:unnamed protein product [Paramecium sonneborni]|uniref:Uncharacterized protein n=1 Tax=Paramecium sonneborni TaxID=65129 RepID=A0A8S1NWN9_9CILI|nr:unnamed protein product [Paramecium sonneborni]
MIQLSYHLYNDMDYILNNKIKSSVNNRERTNVALSRARYCQFIFGTFKTMQKNTLNWNKAIKLVQQKQQIIHYIQEDVENHDFYQEKLKFTQD